MQYMQYSLGSISRRVNLVRSVTWQGSDGSASAWKSWTEKSQSLGEIDVAMWLAKRKPHAPTVALCAPCFGQVDCPNISPNYRGLSNNGSCAPVKLFGNGHRLGCSVPTQSAPAAISCETLARDLRSRLTDNEKPGSCCCPCHTL